jgi:VWFA-related protein
VTGALVVLSLIVVVHARQQPAFRGGVEVVLIDVNVVDAHGIPVGSLQPEDFLVSVDRKPRKIVSAQFIDYGARSVVERRVNPAAGGSALDTLARQPPPAAPSRTVLLVFDEDNLDVAAGMEARKAAAAFLERLGPADRIGVATIPNLRSSITLTRDRADVRKALATVIAGGAPGDNATRFAIGLAEAFAAEQGDAFALQHIIARECRGEPPDCPDEVRMAVRQMQLQARLRGQRAMDALHDLGEGLGRVGGAKTIVFISGGMPMPDVHSVTPLSRLGSALGSAQVSLYTIYIQRAQNGQNGAARGPSPTPQEDIALERDGVENATGAAGGTLMDAVGTLGQYFDRVATEISASYLLGIEVSPTDRDGRPHAVQVKVNRKGVEVRARKEYVIEPEKASPKRADAARPVASAAAHAARLGARPAPPAPELDAVTPELLALLVRAGDFAVDYQSRIDGLLAEEQYDQTLFTWKSAPVTGRGASQAREEWVADKQRRMRSDYLLARGEGAIPWERFRDPFEVDGAAVRPGGRLAKLFEVARAAALKQAADMMAESVRYNLGFGERNLDVPTLALVLLEPANRDRFFFRKEGEQKIDGTEVRQIVFVETATPTAFTGSPLQGTLWIEPQQGRVVRSTLRLNMEEADAEITVTYAPTSDSAGLWVPVELREIYTSDTQKLETVARYSKFRILK